MNRIPIHDEKVLINCVSFYVSFSYREKATDGTRSDVSCITVTRAPGFCGFIQRSGSVGGGGISDDWDVHIFMPLIF